MTAASCTQPETRPATPGRGHPESAWLCVSAHLRLWIVAALCLWADLGTKHWAFSSLGDHTRTLVPGFLEARRSLNSGALFGTFSGWVAVFIVASLLALAFVLYFFACSHRRQWFLHLGLAFVLSGAVGNLYDRAFVQADVITLMATATGGPDQVIGLILSEPDADPVVVGNFPDKTDRRTYDRSDIQAIDHHGVVRDFIKFIPLGTFDYWPWVFNIADALLVAGVIVLMLTFWRDHRAMKAAGSSAARVD